MKVEKTSEGSKITHNGKDVTQDFLKTSLEFYKEEQLNVVRVATKDGTARHLMLQVKDNPVDIEKAIHSLVKAWNYQMNSTTEKMVAGIVKVVETPAETEPTETPAENENEKS